MKKVVLIGGHPKGYDKPFHIKTKSGKVLRKILNDLNINSEIFNLCRNQFEEDSRVLSKYKKVKIKKYANEKYKVVALGRYIEKVIKDSGFNCEYLPHPASRDKKYINQLRNGLSKLK